MFNADTLWAQVRRWLKWGPAAEERLIPGQIHLKQTYTGVSLTWDHLTSTWNFFHPESELLIHITKSPPDTGLGFCLQWFLCKGQQKGNTSKSSKERSHSLSPSNLLRGTCLRDLHYIFPYWSEHNILTLTFLSKLCFLWWYFKLFFLWVFRL